MLLNIHLGSQDGEFSDNIMQNESCVGYVKLEQEQEKYTNICNNVLSVGDKDRRYFCQPTYLVHYLCNHVLRQGKNDKKRKKSKNN